MSNRRFPFSGSGSGERLKFYPNMKAIIAEKPSVGMDIARVVGATDKKDGYCTGNGYMVTWALGHLVSLAMPGAYGYTKTSAENLPMLPDPFRLVSRQVRTDKGMVTDIAAAKQLKIIDSVFDRCDSIIVATDCAREGELIFRWIYSYLGYTKPFKRLWISSLTDEAIREGLANLRDGSDYDSLYAAADCRAKADWLVGMNASRALAVASGSANNSIGRVQTPTLAMVCARFKENRNFVSTPYWQLHLTLKRQDAHRMFIHTEEFKEKDAAEAAYRKITSGSVATVTGSEHKRTFQQAPLLYDLTTLQKDCNVHYDLTAEKTLSIAQSLYEKKLISYPRTGSRHIPEDVMRHIPSLLGKVVSMPEFREYGQSFDMSDLNTRSVDDTKVTDHHALIITGISPEGLSEAESTVYTLIAGRMLEAFSPPCEKELLVMECACEGMAFRSRSSSIVRPGWRGVFARKEDREKDEPERDGGTAEFAEGETVPVMGHGMAQKKTLPKPLYTEATLLAAMETCGKNITDEQAKAQESDARNNLSYTEIKSPSNGVVGTLPYRIGALVGPNMAQPFTVVSDNAEMYAYFSISENMLRRYSARYGSIDSMIAGTPEVGLQLNDGSLYKAKGRIETVSGVVDPVTGTVQIKALFPNPDRELLSGSIGNVILQNPKTEAVTIPMTATVELQDKIIAYRLKNGQAEAAYLTVDRLNDGNRFIVKEGLSVGDTIVAEGVGLVREGMSITPKDETK